MPKAQSKVKKSKVPCSARSIRHYPDALSIAVNVARAKTKQTRNDFEVEAIEVAVKKAGVNYQDYE